MLTDHEDCDRCGERFVGPDAIRSYLRDRRGGLDRWCIDCLDLERRAASSAATGSGEASQEEPA